MEHQKGNGLVKKILVILISLLTAALFGLISWNVHETHCISNQLGIIQQQVQINKELRKEFQDNTNIRLSAVEQQLAQLVQRVAKMEQKLSM